MKNSKLYPAIVLSSICLIAALLLAVINYFTAPIIKDREDKKASEALLEVLPDGKDFRKLELNEKYPKTVTEVYSADGGFVFRASGKGRNGDIVIMVGVDSEGKIVGTQIISEGESKGYKEKILDKVLGTDGEYKGQTYDTFAPIIASGATLTSNGFADAIKAALQAFEVANGGNVDLRTPEEILQENCNVALGTENKTFTKWFATEEIVGIDAVYETDGGRVYVIGEKFIGLKSDGTFTTSDTSEEEKTKVTTADAIISASTTTEITTLPAGIGEEVTKVEVTASGNYVFYLSAKGYDVKFEYSDGHMPGNTPKPITIKLSISADGKIIECRTEDQRESEGIGDVCASEDYQNQWTGKENADVTVVVGVPGHNTDLVPEGSTDLGAIAGATYTTQGYQKAVKAAFAAFELLTASQGGNG